MFTPPHTHTYLWWLDANVLIQLRVCEGQLHSLLDLLHLLLKTTNVCIALQRRLLNLQAVQYSAHTQSDNTHNAQEVGWFTRREQTKGAQGREYQVVLVSTCKERCLAPD